MFRLDESLLQAQRQRAAAALEAATGQYSHRRNSGLPAPKPPKKPPRPGLEAAQAIAQAERLPVQQALDDLTVNAAAGRGEAAAQRGYRQSGGARCRLYAG